MEIYEILENPTFWILSGVGYAAFVIMLIILKGMNNADIMPWWVKIIVIIVIPIVASLFVGYASGD